MTRHLLELDEKGVVPDRVTRWLGVVFTFGNCVDKFDGASTSDDYKHIFKQIEKVKYSAFVKVKNRTGQTDKKLENLLSILQSNPTLEVKEKVSERILGLQREDFEKERNDIMVLKKEKGI